MASFFDNKARAAAAKAAQTNGASSSKSKKDSDEHSHLQPWVEKYRPKTLQDITSQTHTTHLLARTLRSTNLPHLLFYGPPGTGKTSTILALSKQLFGPDLFRSRVLELNASDERGISIVRSKIKDFARQQLSALPAGPAGQTYRDRYPCPPFKIVVLDEADSMTQDAQAALRRTMETYSRITRFCLVCNYVTRIIDPLASRCSKFRFKSLDSVDAVARLKSIAHTEGITLADGAATTLARAADGDLRRAITFLQSAARLVVGSNNPARDPATATATALETDTDTNTDANAPPAITPPMVDEIAGTIPASVLRSLTSAILMPLAHRSNTAAQYDAIAGAITDIMADGWPATQLLGQLFDALVFDERVGETAKVGMLGVFSEADKRLGDGADEELTLLDVALRCCAFVGAGGQ